MTVSTRVIVIATALGVALLPTPGTLVERWYSGAFYPHLQRILTSFSNVVPFSIFDGLCIAALALTAVLIVRSVSEAGWLRGSGRAALRLLTAAAVVYLLFLATWGLNYRRVALQEKLSFDASRLTSAATGDLAARTVSELNRLYGPAHASAESIDRLARSFFDAQGALGTVISIVPGRPKETLLGGYFHSAAIAGMTDPFFLETLVAPDLLEVERPFVLAHEWAHLAGYADESEASFLAWLACMRGDAEAQYSAWLTLFGHIYAAADNKREIQKQLAIGPRIDLRTISDRYASTPRLVRFAARETYDRYLKANRVERGVESYDGVVQLILGTSFDRDGNPILR
jgi:Protein of unknown function (DUF3810)